MTAAIRWLAPFSFCLLIRSSGPGLQAPSYTPASIVNAATNLPGPMAPNTIATIYGSGLSFTVSALSVEDIQDGELPVMLRGSGTRVLIGGDAAPLLYVSPTQINFIVPANLNTGRKILEVFLDGLRGPAMPLDVIAASPALFQLDRSTVIGTHADGSLISAEKPARSGEDVVLYATGLGATDPRFAARQIPGVAAVILGFRELRMTFDGVAIDAASIFYAGVTPGYAGLYQINLRLPRVSRRDPEVRIAIGDQTSPPALHLPMVE